MPSFFFRSHPFSFALWCPGEGSAWDLFLLYSQHMSNPPPPHLFHLGADELRLWFPSLFLFAYFYRPESTGTRSWNDTATTLDLKIRTFEPPEFRQLLFNLLKTALALQSLTLMSFSVPPVVLTVAPKYKKKLSSSSKISSPRDKGDWGYTIHLMTLAFFRGLSSF